MNIINRFTLQTLKKNKVRTAVTIIGILLSTAMFTAVTSIIISLQQYMVNVEIAASGTWQGRFSNLTEEQAQKLLEKKEITESALIRNVGYAELENCINEDKPYLCIESVTSDFIPQSSLTLVEGRMPENEGELVLSAHLSENGDVNYKVGDTLQLEVGNRTRGEGSALGQGYSLEQHTPYEKDKEKLSDTTTRTYQVVGICERSDFENYSAPGYTAFTTNEKQLAYSYDVLFQVQHPVKIEKFINNFLKKYGMEAGNEIYEIHSGLLRAMGQSPNSNYMSMLWRMGSILIVIIVAASISLIYNAFSISISERTKQFGLLKSIGATKKQIRKSVLFEAFSLCLIGIPLGIGSGLLGIGITLHFVGKLLVNLVAEGESAQLELVISWQAIIPAAIIALITIIISAMLPARRAVKMPAIYALRESNEIKLRKRNVRSSKLVYKLFGFEGMLANKNLKRNRRKHRLTVASLALSVILFVSTNAFTNYMSDSTGIIDDNTVHDIQFYVTQEELNNNDLSQTKIRLKQVKYVDEVAYSSELDGISKIPIDSLNPQYQELVKQNTDRSGKNVLIDTCFIFVDNNTYKKYLEEQNLDLDQYLNRDTPSPLIWDTLNMLTESNQILTTNILSDKGFLGSAYYINFIKNHSYTEQADPDKLTLTYVNERDDDTLDDSDSNLVTMPKEKALTEVPVKNARVMDGILPLGAMKNRWRTQLTMVLPYSVYETFSTKTLQQPANFNFMVQAKQHKQATEALTSFFKNDSSYKSSIASHISDVRASDESDRSLMLIIKIFTYGFISLITLIVVANVFNTISTNIQLRRKEYAMLKSVGMTQKGFDRMMNYECILYGLKGLLFGLPVSFILCYLMHKSVMEVWDMPFVLPWTSIIIVCICVFVIVFASMLYSMSKIKKDNPIDALRNDNL